MHFTKMNGAGNDFIIIEDKYGSIKDWEILAKKLCNRHFGVGGDGILVLRESDKADAEMLIYNSDGSLADMCGNGIRCFAKYMYDRGYVSGSNVNIKTGDGIKRVELVKAGDEVSGAKVNMGQPKLKPEAIPSVLDGDCIINRTVSIEGEEYKITSMNMGVPHTIVFVKNIDGINLVNKGSEIEKSKLFPEGTNVNFVMVENKDEFTVRTWERGAGLTMACGTGACASLVACVLNGKTERKASVHLLGGDLVIEWKDEGSVYMTGPCETVFIGEY